MGHKENHRFGHCDGEPPRFLRDDHQTNRGFEVVFAVGYSAGAIGNFLIIDLAVIIATVGILHVRQERLHSPCKVE